MRNSMQLFLNRLKDYMQSDSYSKKSNTVSYIFIIILVLELSTIKV